MSAPDSISVTIEAAENDAGKAHNALPLLHEIRHALERLSTTGQSMTIDLSSIPFLPGDRQQLLDILGSGEVTATVDAMGPTHIRETAFPGVWLIRHLSVDEKEVASHIEICRIPSLLATPDDDIADSLSMLQKRLSDEFGDDSR